MGSRNWLAGWSRFARVVIEAEIADARAALMDSNGDEREMCFYLDFRAPSGERHVVLDWDDVGGHHPVSRLLDLFVPDTDVVFGWGTGTPRQRRTAGFGDLEVPIRVNRDGWWLVLAHVPASRATT